jgi:hypothetical protein
MAQPHSQRHMLFIDNTTHILCSFGEVMSQNIIDKMSRVQTDISFNCFNGNEGKKWMSRLGDIITNAHQYLDNTKTIPNRIDYFY